MAASNDDIIIQELPDYESGPGLRALGRDRRTLAGAPGQQLSGYLDQSGRQLALTGNAEAPYVQPVYGQWATGAFNAVTNGAILLARPGRMGRLVVIRAPATGDFRYVLLINTTAKALADIDLTGDDAIIWRGVLPPADIIDPSPGVFEISFMEIGGLAFDRGIAFAVSTSLTAVAGSLVVSGNVSVGGL